MKRYILLTFISVLPLCSMHAQQGGFITFENIPLPHPGMDYTQTIDTGNYVIWTGAGETRFYGRKNADSSYEGFTYSNIQDSITPDLANDRAAFPAIGHLGSAQYGVGHGICGMHIDLFPSMKPMQGAKKANIYSMYVTNSTFAVLSMEHGDSTAKKFGGLNGTDHDWFLLTIKGYNYTDSTVDSVLFYLADFRSDTPSQDYIIKAWTEVDLSAMGRVDSLSFSLSSSDTGVNGMNTPAYFCIDDIFIEGQVGSIQEHTRNKLLTIYPDPVMSGGTLHLKVQAAPADERYTIRMSNEDGKTVLKKEIRSGGSLVLPNLSPGLYFLAIYDKQQQIISRQKITVW